MGGRRKRSLINTVAALLSEFFVILVGLFFPRVLISCYGSPTNGLISSLQQFAQYFTLISTGLLGAIVYALYSPLADGKKDDVEQIVASAGKVFTRMGMWYTAALVVFGLVYPLLLADTPYSYWQVLLMFIAIGVNGASQLFYSGKYKALLNASQHNGVIAIINSVFTSMFSLIMIVCALLKVNVLVAVCLASVAYFMRAAAYGVAVKRIFPGYSFKLSQEPYKFGLQRDVMIHHILSLIVMNSPMIILVITGTDLAEVSVFTTYNLILTAIFTISGAVNSGVSASFGDLIIRNDHDRLRSVYREYEGLFQIFWTVAVSCTTVLFFPFIKLYTVGISDADYVRPLLCILFGIFGALWMIHTQQSTIIVAAGKYKEIQKENIIEAVLAVVLSLAGHMLFGLKGLVLGRIIVTLYRVISFTRFNSRYVVGGEFGYTWTHIIVSAVIVAAVNIVSASLLTDFIGVSFIRWIASAVLVAAVSLLLSVMASFLLDREAFGGRVRSLVYKFGKK